MRPPAVAGHFYPAAAAELNALLERLLTAATVRDPNPLPPKILVVPHAGYIFSGSVAARAYAELARWRGRYQRVVLLGPTHRVAVQGVAVPSVAAFETPLGAVPLDREALDSLSDLPWVGVSDAAHAQEHALEVQLPFLQRALGDFKLVPLAVGRAAPQDAAALLERLWGGDETLIVISTDLSHYLPYEQAQAADRATIDQVLRGDATLNHQQACGATPLAGALLVAQRHGLTPQLLDLRNSGDTAGDKERVVGYAALAFTATATPAAGRTRAQAADEGTQALGRALLTQARQVILKQLGLPAPAATDHPALHAPGAVFVTLNHQGQLRGCIGSLQASRSLGDDVRNHALNAAFKDPRFAPLTREEWPEVELEVSVLAPPEPFPVQSEMDAFERLRPGVDGVILSWQGHRATFLPQVWSQLRTPRVFLAALKRKAGLAPDFWAPDVQLHRYRVKKFVAAKH